MMMMSSAAQPKPNASSAAAPPAPAILLALDAGTRNTGWAIFEGYAPLRTGVIALRRRQHNDDAASRIARLVVELDELAVGCAPAAVAVSQPAGLGGPTPAPALALLETALAQWGRRAGIPLAAYPAAEARRAVAGHPRAAPQAVAFAVMSALNLLGTGKSADEWAALAVGAYHLYRTMPPDCEPVAAIRNPVADTANPVADNPNPVTDIHPFTVIPAQAGIRQRKPRLR